MGTGFRGTFVISWSQTEVDGLRAAGTDMIGVGATWRWGGTAVRVDGPRDLLLLDGAKGAADLRKRAARSVRRLVGAALEAERPQGDTDMRDDDTGPDSGFVVTDGRRTFTVTLIDVPGDGQPLLMFLDEMPPAETELWIVQSALEARMLDAMCGVNGGVICFARGTRISTPDGPRAVEDLREGDRISTRDDGAQEVLWIGQRRMSGARLYAMPHLRPIRIRAGALGRSHPEPDLVVSPRHRVLLKGAVAQELFNTREVLVAAEDMLNDRTILRDHSIREVRYHHLLLGRHQIVWANGVEAESFHPAHTSLDTIDPDQRIALADALAEAADNPQRYGPAARRMLSDSEAAILLYEARNRQGASRRL